MPKQCCKNFFASVPDDEPVFTLAARDLTAPKHVQDWIDGAKAAGVNDDKVRRAQEHLDAMREFQSQHPEQCKMPD